MQMDWYEKLDGRYKVSGARGRPEVQVVAITGRPLPWLGLGRHGLNESNHSCKQCFLLFLLFFLFFFLFFLFFLFLFLFGVLRPKHAVALAPRHVWHATTS